MLWRRGSDDDGGGLRRQRGFSVDYFDHFTYLMDHRDCNHEHASLLVLLYFRFIGFNICTLVATQNRATPSLEPMPWEVIFFVIHH